MARNYPFWIGLCYIVYLVALSVGPAVRLELPWWMVLQIGAMLGFPFVLGILAGLFWKEAPPTPERWEDPLEAPLRRGVKE